MNLRFVAVAAAALFALAGAVPTLAQQTPLPAPTAQPSVIPSVPPAGGLEKDAIDAVGNFVKSAFGWNDNEALGTVTYFRGYEMQVRMQLDRYREIHLHRGTVINPRGTTIKPGEQVDVRGRGQADGSLVADSILVQNPH